MKRNKQKQVIPQSLPHLRGLSVIIFFKSKYKFALQFFPYLVYNSLKRAPTPASAPALAPAPAPAPATVLAYSATPDHISASVATYDVAFLIILV